MTDPFDCGRLVDQASLGPGGNLLVVTTHENKLMGFRRRESRRVETGIPLRAGPRVVAFSEDGSWFAVSQEDGTVEVTPRSRSSPSWLFGVESLPWRKGAMICIQGGRGGS